MSLPCILWMLLLHVDTHFVAGFRGLLHGLLLGVRPLSLLQEQLVAAAAAETNAPDPTAAGISAAAAGKSGVPLQAAFLMDLPGTSLRRPLHVVVGGLPLQVRMGDRGVLRVSTCKVVGNELCNERELHRRFYFTNTREITVGALLTLRPSLTCLLPEAPY